MLSCLQRRGSFFWWHFYLYIRSWPCTALILARVSDINCRLVTDSSTRNHFREKNARENWRESMMSKTDLDRLERGTEWTSGYTGHVPRLRDTFAMRNVVAAQFLKPDASVLEDLLPNMHESLPMTTGSSSRLTTAGSSRSGVGVAGPRVEGVCGGQRRLVVSPTQKYPGNGFCGTVLPSRRTDRISRCGEGGIEGQQ